MPDYSINIPVNLVGGQEKLNQLLEAIKQTGQQTRIAGTDFRTWRAAIEQAAGAGYTLNTALNKVRSVMKEAGIDVGAFTDRLKANVKEQDAMARAAERAAERAATAAERSAERAIRASERAAEAQQRAIARAEAAAIRASEREAVRAARQTANGENVVGRIGGRIIGGEIGGSLGIPGAGFIGSQTVQSLGISGGAAIGLGAAAVGVYGVYEILSKANATAKWAQEQRNLSREFGISAGQMATFTLIAEQTGTHIEGSIKAISNLSSEMEKGGPRAREISTALHELGLSQSVAFKPAAEAIKDVLAAIGKIPDAATAAQLSVGLIGESGRQLASMVKDFPELQDKLKVDDETINRIARFRDVISDMSSSATLGALDAISYVLSGILPDRTQRADSRAVPHMAPLQMPGSIHIGGVPTGEITRQSPAEIRSQHLDYSRQLAMSSGTPEDVYKAEVDRIDDDRAKLQKDWQGLTITPEAYKQQVAILKGRKQAAENKKQAAEEFIHQQRAFAELPPTGELDFEQLVGERHSLEKRFFRLKGTTGYKQRQAAIGGAESELGSAAAEDLQRRQFDSLMSHLTTEGARTSTREDQRNRESVGEIENIVRINNIKTRGDLTLDEAFAGRRSAASQGLTTFNRMGMTPSETSTLDYRLAMQSISGTATPQAMALGSQIGTLQNAVSWMGRVPGEQAEKATEVLQADLSQKMLDLKALEITTTTKSIDAANKFNEAIVKAAEAMRSEFASGFSSVIMGAQHGRGGALGALRGFGEKIEGTFLRNIGEKVWDNGVGKIAGSIGSGLPDWLTKGTVFGHLNQKLNPDLMENSLAVRDSTTALRDLAAVIRSAQGGTGSGSPASGAVPGGTSDYTPVPVGGAGGTGAAGVASDIGAMASVAGSLAGVTGGSTGAKLSAVSSSLAKLDAVMKGTKYAGNIPKILSGELSGKETVGAVAGTIGLGLAAYQGVSTIARGGAKNAFGGAGMTLAAIAPFTGPAAPFVATAGAVAGLVSAFIPDGKTVRAQQQERRMFTQQYLAPQARNLSVGGGGSYSDVDFMGNVRESHFSPYPIFSNSYLDVPRRTVVPGHTLSGFGGIQNVTGAKTPTIVHYHNWNVNTMDAKSFLDNGGRILDAVNHALSESYHPVVRTLGAVLGRH